ncbi:GNAT family N-acetyltransferase [Rhodanobacter glycinis]|jgi:ribosomal protein S18 acetylase RimI-like enzyme|uniref:Acetyltransferase (GNAT) family protein n=1 Tax=Rhodanobacter glycinis TaxID=582702 RepID=A0A1I4EQX9_9GAMM|nr:GNAT family N-acetyltransferase [Rhodanobacter glycinis]SFL07500.1 Acetyltransferase (GNAT) family protein [Rhodanobacter glycinis]
MPASPAIRVCPVTPDLREAVLALHVKPAQDDFVSPPEITLPDAERCPGSTPMAILQGEAVVGYYRIETSARTLTGNDSESDALGLRSFQIDATRQGQGLGTRALAALLDDLGHRRPEASRLVLTVDRSNTTAVALYLRAGFVDSGRLYHGGRAGPQLLLWRSLR